MSFALCLLAAIVPAAPDKEAAAEAILAGAIRDERVKCASPAADLDGDGQRDLACITRRGADKPQHVVVVLAAAPKRLAFDAPFLRCADCGGALGLDVEIEAAGATGGNGSVTVTERGGSREGWQHSATFVHRSGAFRFESEVYLVGDRLSGDEVSLGTEYYNLGAGDKDYPPNSSRDAKTSGGDEVGARWFDLYALPDKGAVKAMGSSLRPWPGATPLGVQSLIAGNDAWSDDDDLSVVVRARLNGPELRLEVEVKDDDVQVAAESKPGAGERLELWWDRGSNPPQAESARLEPSAETTDGVSFALKADGKVGVTRLFPEGGSEPKVRAAWKRLAKGYILELRISTKLLEGAHGWEFGWEEEPVANLSIIVRDADAGVDPANQTVLATSRMEHPGAPFEMGRLHLPRTILRSR